jgi:hypothetical protein
MMMTSFSAMRHSSLTHKNNNAGPLYSASKILAISNLRTIGTIQERKSGIAAAELAGNHP